MTAIATSPGRMSPRKFIERLLMLLDVGVHAYKGGIACVNASGYIVQGKPGLGLVRVGTFYEEKDNSAGTSQVPVNIELDDPIWARWFANDTTAPVKQAHMIRDCFILDDQTVTADSGNSIGGRVWGLDSARGVLVECTFGDQNPDQEPYSLMHQARAVITSIASYVASGGVLTASATGAIGAQDGVTLVAGDVVLLPTDKATAAKDAGPYVVTNPGAVGAKFVLTRPDWYRTGSTQPSGQMLTVGGEGTLRAGSEWKAMVAASTFVVDTTDGQWYPRLEAVTTAAMTAGVSAANSTLYVSAKAQFSPMPVTPGGTQGTLRMSTSTAGPPGTSSLVVTSSSNTDTSTVKIQVENF